MKKVIITAADGYKLSALYAIPVGECAGTIILSSATGIKKEFYINFAHFLVQNGYRVLLYDYRGIGGSAPLDLRSSDSYMHEWGTLDMNAALNYLVEKKGLTDIIWLGHSVGAQMVGFIEHRQHIRKVISISAAFGYWKYFPSPEKWKIWGLWYFMGPIMVRLYGYGPMKKIGWGENLSPNMMKEWREWCLSKNYFTGMLKRILNKDKFYGFTTPITSLYMSDDYLANDKTAQLMMGFFPDSPQELYKLPVEEFTSEKVGHVGIFRKKFENDLWPVLAEVIDR
ncbi:MAG: alpha/beta fold hydrolase [Gemmatimonadaceae bacterium]|nr:alpha/beta fold hydrolase [Chitinophagaceae bacterium]